MKFLVIKISTLYLLLLSFKVNGSEFRILSIDKCKGHENYLIIEQCEASGNIVNAKARFISTIDSIIVSHSCRTFLLNDKPLNLLLLDAQRVLQKNIRPQISKNF